MSDCQWIQFRQESRKELDFHSCNKVNSIFLSEITSNYVVNSLSGMSPSRGIVCPKVKKNSHLSKIKMVNLILASGLTASMGGVYKYKGYYNNVNIFY